MWRKRCVEQNIIYIDEWQNNETSLLDKYNNAQAHALAHSHHFARSYVCVCICARECCIYSRGNHASIHSHMHICTHTITHIVWCILYFSTQKDAKHWHIIVMNRQQNPKWKSLNNLPEFHVVFTWKSNTRFLYTAYQWSIFFLP